MMSLNDFLSLVLSDPACNQAVPERRLASTQSVLFLWGLGEYELGALEMIKLQRREQASGEPMNSEAE